MVAGAWSISLADAADPLETSGKVIIAALKVDIARGAKPLEGH